MKKIFILVALLFAAKWLSAQDTKSPLLLYISGSGKIVPFHDGQMLDDGRDYVMTAIPDRGYVFTNWQQVYVFTQTQYYPSNGVIIGTSETIVSPRPPLPGKNRVLHFTMEPEEFLIDEPGINVLSLSEGWQANFVPRPEKRCRK